MSADEVISIYGEPSNLKRVDGMEVWSYEVGINPIYQYYKDTLVNRLWFSLQLDDVPRLTNWDLINIKSYEHPEFTLENTRKVKLGMTLKEIRELFGTPDGFTLKIFGQATLTGPWEGLICTYRMDAENPESTQNSFIFSTEEQECKLVDIDLNYIR
jgi:hypothetical protein